MERKLHHKVINIQSLNQFWTGSQGLAPIAPVRVLQWRHLVKSIQFLVTTRRMRDDGNLLCSHSHSRRRRRRSTAIYQVYIHTHTYICAIFYAWLLLFAVCCLRRCLSYPSCLCLCRCASCGSAGVGLCYTIFGRNYGVYEPYMGTVPGHQLHTHTHTHTVRIMLLINKRARPSNLHRRRARPTDRDKTRRLARQMFSLTSNLNPNPNPNPYSHSHSNPIPNLHANQVKDAFGSTSPSPSQLFCLCLCFWICLWLCPRFQLPGRRCWSAPYGRPLQVQQNLICQKCWHMSEVPLRFHTHTYSTPLPRVSNYAPWLASHKKFGQFWKSFEKKYWNTVKLLEL